MLHDSPQYRNRLHALADRAEAGRLLAEMLEPYRATDAVVLAIPAGGVPVAAEIARALSLPLDVAVVSKITLPWTTEAGYGAVAWDGTVRLNEQWLPSLGLTEAEVGEGIAKTTDKVRRRTESFRDGRKFPQVSQLAVILVDDGLASGFTMRVAIEALRKAEARQVVVAVPTALQQIAEEINRLVAELYCLNLRDARPFAVADAYRNWYDVSEQEAAGILAGLKLVTTGHAF